MAAPKFNHLKNFLEIWGNEVVEKAKDNLSAGKRGGGRLEKSIDFDLIPEVEGYTIKFKMDDYGSFMDKGVKGAGGKIKSGDHEGSWGGRRWFVNYKGKREDSPFQFGSGKSSGSIYKGIESFIKSKGLKPKENGTITGLKIAMVRVLWTKGIHGISFFQNSLMLGLKSFRHDMIAVVKEDIIDTLVQIKGIDRA